MAGPIFADRVQENSTTTGTGTYTLSGATTGYQAWSVVGNANTAYYMATDGVNWEVGLGTYTLSGTTLARTTVLSSSNANAAVSWSAGTRTISLVDPAAALANFTWPVATRTAMAALATSQTTSVYLLEVGRQGTFLWNGANLSTQVTADTQQGIYVPPASDTTGASGAWVRTFDGPLAINWFGGVGDNSTDNILPLAGAFKVLPASGGGVYFPAGIFKFSTLVTMVLAASQSVTFIGAGQDATVLNFPNSTNGLRFTYPTATGTASTHFRHFSIVNGAANNGVGVELDGNASLTGNPSYAEQNDFFNVTFRGNDGPVPTTNYWAAGVKVNGVSNVEFTNCLFQGPSAVGGIGIQWNGINSTAQSVQAQVVSCNFNNLTSGFVYGTQAQGVFVTSSNFTNCTNGINVTSSGVNLDQLIVQGNQFNTLAHGILYSTAVSASSIIGNLFIIGAGASDGINGPMIDFKAVGNSFGNSVGVNAAGLALGGSTVRALIIGNQFFGLTGVGGVVINSGATNVTIADNNFSSVTTPISNLSAANSGHIIRDNSGYNPVGAVASANVGTSPATITAGPSPETHYLKQTATNTATVTQGGQQIAALANASTYYQVNLGPNESYVVTWTTTQPTVTKFVH